MAKGMQSGDLRRVHVYWREVVQNMPSRKCECLDVGCGVVFLFEKYLFKIRKKKDKIDCIDIRNLARNEIPSCIRSYTNCTIEEPLNLKKKYDCIFCFEVIEHIDKTDVLLENCYNHLKDNGKFFIVAPNLASIFCRIELMIGLQPHLLEASNEFPNCGTGIFGKINNPMNQSIHHIRGITYRAMKDLLHAYGFKIDSILGETSASGGGGKN